MAKAKGSTTQERRLKIYPTPQNVKRIEEAVAKKDGAISKNGLINKALDYFFKNGQAALL